MKLEELRGTKVLDISCAAEVGTVDDVFMHVDEQHIVALSVKSGGLFGRRRALLLSDIKATGENAVTIQQESALQEAKDVAALEHAVGRDAVEGSHVVTENGTDVGKVVDLDADFTSGAINGYVLGGGLIDRLQGTERLIPASTVMKIGSGTIVVADTVVPGRRAERSRPA